MVITFRCNAYSVIEKFSLSTNFVERISWLCKDFVFNYTSPMVFNQNSNLIFLLHIFFSCHCNSTLTIALGKNQIPILVTIPIDIAAIYLHDLSLFIEDNCVPYSMPLVSNKAVKQNIKRKAIRGILLLFKVRKQIF